MKAKQKIITAGILLGAVASTYAIPTASLKLNDGTSDLIVVADNSGSDLNPAVGAITVSYSDANWTVTVNTGVSKPILGSAANPVMDLALLDVSSASAGATLHVLFSDTGFGTPGGSAETQFGGTTGGTITVKTYQDTSDTLFGTSTLLTTIGPLGPGAVSGTASAATISDASYSLTLHAIISHGRPGVSSGDAFLHVPDGGATAILLGVGFLGLGAIARRKE